MPTQSLKDRVILVTGASRGIGYAAALACAKAGAHIVAIARTQGGLEDLDDAIKNTDGDCTLVPFDLKSPDGLSQLAEIVADRWGRLDGLIAAAGMLGDITPAQQIDAKSFDDVMTVNVTANQRLIQNFAGLLRQSDAGRAVFVTSSVASNGRAFWGSYAASKGALEGLVNSYASEVEQTPVKVCLLDPGGVRTAMRAKAFPGEDPETLPSPHDVAPMLVELMHPSSTVHGETVSYRSWAS